MFGQNVDTQDLKILKCVHDYKTMSKKLKIRAFGQFHQCQYNCVKDIFSKTYMIVTTVINIFGQLTLDDELTSKIIQKGLQKIINLVFMCHPHRVKQLKFIDINQKDYPKAILDFSKAYSEKVDVWDLGCILYEVLQQNPAFQSANPLMLERKIVQLEYESINQGIYKNELMNIVELCLQKEEDKRPSVNELLEMISLKVIVLMEYIKQEKDDLKSELQDLRSIINDQQYEIKKEQQLVWNIFQKLLQLSHQDYKTIDAKNQYIIEQFRRKISKSDNEINIQAELNKLTSLSKEQISYLPKINY
ncbi:unnamed protein product [Paramecium sonneborni]|uniref:non-specific serine/threonine protein kinase n=1 Tax=Paramecium sonneborni TaxID=65129 RepID=A0A8S1L1Q6_9CILI|nr:unnamed protein product [Paramecium sonneborni]